MDEIVRVFGINWKLLALQGLNFSILLVALWYFLYRPVIGIIEKRKKVIAEGVAKAEEAAKELAGAAGKRDMIISEASRQAESLVAGAKERAGVKERELIGDAERRGREILEGAEKQAQEEKRRALEESKEELARLAVLGMEKLLKEKGI